MTTPPNNSAMIDLSSEILVSHQSVNRLHIGGKATQLLELVDLGFKVPSFVVIPSDYLEGLLPTNVNQNSEELCTAIDHLNLGLGLFEEILQALPTATHFAVRSSANVEDSKSSSYAGQFASVLFVPKTELEAQIKKVWKSAFSTSVAAYQEARNNSAELPKMAIIIQEMIPADAAGVGFGVNPQTRKGGSAVLTSTYGIGEALVSGEVNADQFVFQDGELIEENITSKKFQGRLNSLTQCGTTLSPVPDALQNEASLSSEHRTQLLQTLSSLEKHFNHPQDIEFAVFNNELFLLQTRPITTSVGEYILWDNSNIVESYPGITTPLTFSFIEKMYEAVYRQLVELFGVSKDVVEQNTQVFANCLGLVRGRVYYNLLSWYKMLAMVPGYSINAQFMENMMGVKERFHLEEDYRTSKSLAWVRIVKMVFNMIKLHRRLPADRKQFQKELNSTLSHYQGLDLNSKSLEELITLYETFEVTLLEKWKPPLTNDFFAMIWFGMLQKSVQKHLGDAHPNLHNDLLCGSNDIISTEPIFRLMSIAKEINSSPATLMLFKDHSATEVLDALQRGQHPKIWKAIQAYIVDFGDRCIGELKLESLSYGDAPELLIEVLQSYAANSLTKTQQDHSLENKLRTNAEALMEEALSGKWLPKRLYKWVLKNTRDIVSNRENLRYERTRAFGMVRKIMVAMGHKLFQAGRINDARDIFYLELSEVLQLKQQTNEALFNTIEERKETFEKYAQQPIPSERFFTYGKEFKDEFIYSKQKLEPVEGDLQGIGCCPGQVEGKVRIVLDPKSVKHLDGDILVTSSTDPGWVTLFPSASAIIVERGSLLSHSAIVSRELGIPCIVGVSGLLRTLKDGEEVIMDGSTGVIKRKEES